MLFQRWFKLKIINTLSYSELSRSTSNLIKKTFLMLTSSANWIMLRFNFDTAFLAPWKSCFFLTSHAGDSGINRTPMNVSKGMTLKINAVVCKIQYFGVTKNLWKYDCAYKITFNKKENFNYDVPANVRNFQVCKRIGIRDW